MPKVSIITPTADRGHLLPAALKCVARQDYRDWEWLILDDGANPCPDLQACTDPRVRYVYDEPGATVGAKRNRLIAAATGDVIVQFDDDDYYAPRYISTLVTALERDRADFVKLSSFFLYHVRQRKFAYWELSRVGGHHFVFGRSGPPCEISNRGEPATSDILGLGFGFSYVFRRSLWERNPFPDKNFGEDQDFATAALGAGHCCTVIEDRQGLCLHILHAGNMSKAYPQYLLPDFVGERMFPQFDLRDYG